MMISRIELMRVLTVAVLAVFPGALAAQQNYPTKLIRWVTPSRARYATFARVAIRSACFSTASGSRRTFLRACLTGSMSSPCRGWFVTFNPHLHVLAADGAFLRGGRGCGGAQDARGLHAARGDVP